MKFPIYLDHHATTPVDPRVLEAMIPYFTEKFGNAASYHRFGWQAEEAVEKARRQVAEALGTIPQDIFFTSGATESNNLALVGLSESFRGKKNHLITCQTEHSSVLDTCRFLEKKGVVVTYLPVDGQGQVDPSQVARAITSETFLISLMLANNEIGTLHPIAEIGKIAREKNVLFHTDATQAIGRVDLDVRRLPIDLFSLSGHKIYGPKGVGALYVRSKLPCRLTPILHGGGHERGIRSGTLNVPGIVGLGKAVQLALELQDAEVPRIQKMRDQLQQKILQSLDGVRVNGHATERLAHNLHLSFEKVSSVALMMEMQEIAISAGSACSSAIPEPTHVLKALGIRKELAENSIRMGLGRETTEEEIDYVAEKLIVAVRKLREKSNPI